MRRRVGGDEMELTRAVQRGAYAGRHGVVHRPAGGQQTATPARCGRSPTWPCWRCPPTSSPPMLRRWFPMAMHLLEGLFLGAANTQALVGPAREAAWRWARCRRGSPTSSTTPRRPRCGRPSSLRERVAGMRHKLAHAGEDRHRRRRARALVDLQEDAVKRVADAPELSPLEASDREDDVGTGWRTTASTARGSSRPMFVAAGLDARLARAAAVGARRRRPGRVGALARATRRDRDADGRDRGGPRRISTLVTAAKNYSPWTARRTSGSTSTRA